MTTYLWTHEDAEAATKGGSTSPWKATGISIDTRTLVPGDLFIAIEGPQFDGHDFVEAAFAAGAAAAMVSRTSDGVSKENGSGEKPLLFVEDSFEGLNNLAAAARSRTNARIAAITGSVGKTSTKEGLRLVLSAQGATTASQGNLNNQLGLPLSLARMPQDSRYGIFEMGMNHAGELTPLSHLARPHVGVITNIEPVHSEFFDSVAAIADAKAEIFSGMATEKTNNSAVLHRESPFFHILASAARDNGVERIIGFGAHPDADARLVEWRPEENGSRVKAVIDGQIIHFRLNMPGRHLTINALSILAAVLALGADVALAAKTLEEMKPVEGRGQRLQITLPGGAFELIDESYNASPVSVRAALAVLADCIPEKSGRRIIVLGDMLELGSDSQRLHAGLARNITDMNIDLVFTAGPQMAHLYEELAASQRGGHAENADELALLVAQAVRPGDVVTIKGSYGSRMGDVVAALKHSDVTARAVNGN